MNEIIYKGLDLVSKKGCKFFNIKEGKVNSLTEDTTTSTLTLTFVPGTPLGLLVDELGIKFYGDPDEVLEALTGLKKFTKTYVTLNGLKFQKMTADPHIFHMIIVSERIYIIKNL